MYSSVRVLAVTSSDSKNRAVNREAFTGTRHSNAISSYRAIIFWKSLFLLRSRRFANLSPFFRSLAPFGFEDHI